MKKNGVAPLTNWLFSQMQPTDTELQRSTIHAALASLSKCKLFYTTNFDDFLERSLRLHGRTVQVATSERDLNHSGDTQVIKFHGDFNAPDEMVLSESHYERRMRLESAMDLKFRSDILGRAILFVGYSFRDPNIAYLFRTVNEKFGELPHSFAGKRAYIVVTNPSDFELQLFRERKIEVISTFDLDRTRAVAELLTELSS
ncbi:SIR2 family protein [Bradyrhizobium sp. BR 10289]|uniref:SIR2 family NAD-dependent protein deacylase n=1 Tax=Bradyrhizobium sp. BR 10289 TaxID=2749993 RepID=UPI001C64931F|nr:SIR2 family protein [Bradyrhizobium sp. BR 10289]MBW7973458.1 SIR2 family protein [Bradyrhizobium sp. BR 10289]